MNLPQRRVVYVVAKAPRVGESKTRLCPPLAPEQAALLAGALLEDTIALVREARVDVRLICRDEDERRALAPYAAPDVLVEVQDGVGGGAPMESAFRKGRLDGYEAVAVLGMDVPTLPATVIEEAFGALDAADVALGPSVDGGYYLLTARRPIPELFRDMVWSTDQVAAETRRRCLSLGLRVHDLLAWDDVDDFAALVRLRGSVAELEAAVAPRTRAALDQMREVF
jgi:rSAM/selenodomain-associated transferase 1